MSKGIPISPKHGLNPCIPVCLFCGKQKNEIALMGKLPGDAEAPHSAVIDYTPCDECQANWNMGIPLIRVSRRPSVENQPPMKAQGGACVYPTGQYVVMKENVVERIFGMKGTVGSPVLIEDTAFDQLVEQAKASGTVDGNEEMEENT